MLESRLHLDGMLNDSLSSYQTEYYEASQVEMSLCLENASNDIFYAYFNGQEYSSYDSINLSYSQYHDDDAVLELSATTCWASYGWPYVGQWTWPVYDRQPDAAASYVIDDAQGGDLIYTLDASDVSTADMTAGLHFAFSYTYAGLPDTYGTAGTINSFTYDPELDEDGVLHGRVFDKDGKFTDVPINAPMFPTLNWDQVRANSVRFSWNNGITQGQEQQWIIQRAPDVGGHPGTWATIGTAQSGSASYPDNTVTPGTRYWYRVRAQGTPGTPGDTQWSAKRAVTTWVPPTGTIANSGPCDEGAFVTVTVAASDPQDRALAYSFRVFPWDPLAEKFEDASIDPVCVLRTWDNGVFPVTGRVINSDNEWADFDTLITVSNVAPNPTISYGGAREGASVTLTATHGDPGAGDTFTYAWNVTKGGTTFATGSSRELVFTPPDNGNYTAEVIVTDDDGASGTATQIVTVNNSKPTAKLSNSTFDVTTNYGSTITVTFSNQWDDSPDDRTAGFTYSYDFNDDGTYEVVNSASPTITYTDPSTGWRTYKVRATITDKDGGATTYRTTVYIDAGLGILTDAEGVVITGSEPSFESWTGANNVYNNCYNFAVNYQNDSGPPAQPGGTQMQPVVAPYTPESVRAGAEADGLVFLGDTTAFIRTNAEIVGNYRTYYIVALWIDLYDPGTPDDRTDYHWYRHGPQGTPWAHKRGSEEPCQYDARGPYYPIYDAKSPTVDREYDELNLNYTTWGGFFAVRLGTVVTA